MRANQNGQLGFHDNDKHDIQYSPFYVCSTGGQRSLSFPATVLDFSGVFTAIKLCLKNVRRGGGGGRRGGRVRGRGGGRRRREEGERVLTLPLPQDTEWEAVFQLFHLLGDLLQDRSLTLSGMADLSSLLPPISALLDCRPGRMALFHTKPVQSEVCACVYRVLARLCTYPSHLDRHAQVRERGERGEGRDGGREGGRDTVCSTITILRTVKM